MVESTYPMQDTHRVEVFQSIEDLLGEGLRDFLVKLAIFPQTAPDRTTRDILEETAPTTSQNLDDNATEMKLTC